jgi:hypothetical protein
MGWNATGAAVGAGAAGFGKFMKHVYKGIIVDIPLAATEGLRAVPRLYGEEVEDYAIRDWKSGAIAGRKNFSQGMWEGFTDIYTQTQKGAQEDGAKGIAKGILKGTVSLGTKVPSGRFYLVGMVNSANSCNSCTGSCGVSSARYQQESPYCH